MTVGAETMRSTSTPQTGSRRVWAASSLFFGVVLFAVCLLPPVSTLARRYEFVEALQFVFLLAGIPALVVLGSPWKICRLSSGHVMASFQGDENRTSAYRLIDRWAKGRERHRNPWRSAGVFVVYALSATFWRTPLAVNALVSHPALTILEALSLTPVGIWIWTELVDSPPLSPRLIRPHRIALAAVSMWVIWILAYFVALSHGNWYTAFVHRAGHGVSLAADQQLSAGAMWIVSGVTYISLIYWNLFKWLQSEEDPDNELRQLVRFERVRRGAGGVNEVGSR